MTYQWDPNKARANLRKHRVRFSDAVAVFEDELAVTIEEERETEERFVTIGRDTLGQILVVVYTWRGESIRMVSARKATARERTTYEEQK